MRHKIKQRWGGFPTEIVLRFRDNTIEMPTKLAAANRVSARIAAALDGKADADVI